MESTIYTVNGKEFELQHHGVKGMKWGVRKKIQDRRNASADRVIRRATTNKAHAKLELDLANADAKARFSNPKKAKKLAAAKATNKADYQMSEIQNNYTIAMQKARKDKSYRQSKEYIKAKTAYGKEQTQQFIYGPYGSQRIHALQNMGKTEKQAKRQATAEIALATVGSIAIAAFVTTMSAKYES